MFFAARKTNRGRPSSVNASPAINILHRVFIIREQLHEIAEISRTWFTAAIHNRERIRSAGRRAYYRDTSFTKRNYCLLPSLTVYARCVNSRHFAEPLCRSISDTRALATRSILTSLSETSITRYRVVNCDRYIEAVARVLSTLEAVFMEHPVETQSVSCAMGLPLPFSLSLNAGFIILVQMERETPLKKIKKK